MAQRQVGATPDTLPADFFNKVPATPPAPDTLPADFFNAQPAAGPRESHGASGSWSAPSVFSQPVPALLRPLEPLARFGRGVSDAVTNTASGLYHAATDPLTEEEKLYSRVQPGSTFLKRTLLDPQLEQAKKAKEAKTTSEKFGHGAAALLPFAGPVAAQVGEQAGTGDIAGAMGTATTAMLAPKLLSELPGAGRVIKSKVGSALSDAAMPAPELTFLRNVPGLDIEVGKLKRGMSELKTGELLSGETIVDVPSARRASTAAQKALHADIDAVVAPQSDIVVPGSRQRLIQSQVSALPTDLRTSNFPKYRREVMRIVEGTPSDVTLGELNAMRKELSATQSPYYGKDIQGKLMIDESVRAKDIARGNTVRELFYEGLDQHGTGGSAFVREGNGRIGSLIELQDILRSIENKASLQSGKSGVSKAASTGSKILSPAKTLREFSSGESSTINADIASAMRRWTPSSPLPSQSQPSALPVRSPQPPSTHVRPDIVQRSSGRVYNVGESSVEAQGRFGRALTGGQKALPAAGDTSTKITPQPPESFSEALARTESPQSKRMRETMAQDVKPPEKGPYNTQDRPATAEEYIRTKGGRTIKPKKKGK